MSFLELSIEFTENQASDILVALLSDIGFEGFIEEDNLLKAYCKTEDVDETALNKIFNLLPADVLKNVSKKNIENINWNQSWERSYSPVIIQNKILIRAPFHQNLPTFPYEMVIEPKMSFGTAHHETTSLMLEMMLSESFDQKKVLDMGCGTGVLSIFAEMLGAKHVIAVDNDPNAYENAIENIRRNHCKNVEVYHGSMEKVGTGSFQILLANINRNILLEHISQYAQKLEKNGSMLLSGFYLPDLESIRVEAKKNNLHFTGYLEKNNWISVTFVKK